MLRVKFGTRLFVVELLEGSIAQWRVRSPGVAVAYNFQDLAYHLVLLN